MVLFEFTVMWFIMTCKAKYEGNCRLPLPVISCSIHQPTQRAQHATITLMACWASNLQHHAPRARPCEHEIPAASLRVACLACLQGLAAADTSFSHTQALKSAMALPWSLSPQAQHPCADGGVVAMPGVFWWTGRGNIKLCPGCNAGADCNAAVEILMWSLGSSCEAC